MTELPDCPCFGATLDKLVQPAMLAALTAGPIHGYRLAERLHAMTGHCQENHCEEKPDLSGIYRFLKKMEAGGLVTSHWETAEKGHAKRLFQITAEGRACLAQWTTTLESYLQAIRNLLHEAKAATTGENVPSQQVPLQPDKFNLPVI